MIMDNNIDSALLLLILKKMKSNNIGNAQYLTGLCTQVAIYCSPSTFGILRGLMYKMFRTWPHYSGSDAYPIQINGENRLWVISPREQYDAVANGNPFYFTEYIELRKDLLNHMIKELEAVCDEQEE